MSPNTFKALAVGAVLGFLFSVGPSCGTPQPTTCGASNCATGCCNNGKCVTGTNSNNTTCGTAGNACSDCNKTSGSSCDKSTFKCSGGNTGGGTGGSTGGGTGGSTGGGTGGTGGGMASCAATCAGCCDATGNCQTNGNTTCGINGATCTTCTAPNTCATNGVCKDTTCSTCTKNGSCLDAGTLSPTQCGNGGIACLDCTTVPNATCSAAGACTGGNCAGCRDTTSACVPGNQKGACGTAGANCMACTGNQVCTNGACVNGTGGGAGGGTGGTGGNGMCNGSPCAGCCGPSGCTSIGFQDKNSCGLNGATCAACPGTQLCTQGVCTGGTAGGAGGSGGAAGGGTGGTGGTGGAANLGAACNTDTDCTGFTFTAQQTANGFKAFCKKNLTEGSPYPGGYCTRRCLADSECPGMGLCDYIDPPYGEFDNICLAPCTGMGQGTCRAGYGCFSYGSSSYCYPFYADGGSDPFPAGPGNVGNPAAGACMNDSMCAPTAPIYPSSQPATFCIPAALPDGGPTGFTNGQCSTECTAALRPGSADPSAWCGTNGVCNPYLFTTQPNTGLIITWLCDQQCTFEDAGVRSTCRTGYACDAVADGKCIPRCDTPGFGACPTTAPNCNATTGLCGP